MRTATWTNIGNNVKTCKSVDEVLKESRLDYKVSKSPILLPNGTEIPDKVATVREDGSYIGVVSSRYELLQNEEAFNFVDGIEGLRFEKAGETKSGMVYIIGALPDVTVLGDTFTPHLIMQTSHNGMYNLKATICPLRIICQNQFAMSFKKMSNTVSIRHSRQLANRLTQAKQLLNQTVTYMGAFKDTAEELASIKISDGNLYRIVDRFFEKAKEDMTERQRRESEERRQNFFKCYNSDDNINFLGTGWGVVNAMTDYETHKKRKQTANVAESSFLNVTFDTVTLPKLITAIRENS